MQFICAQCGKPHDVSEVAFGADAPDQWWLLTPEERATSLLSADQCVIETTATPSFFIRACLEIPIKATTRKFEWCGAR